MHFWKFKSTPFYATCNESKHIYVCTWLYAFSKIRTPNPFLRTCGRSKEFQTLSRYQSGYSNTSAQVKKRLCRLIKIYPRSIHGNHSKTLGTCRGLAANFCASWHQTWLVETVSLVLLPLNEVAMWYLLDDKYRKVSVWRSYRFAPKYQYFQNDFKRTFPALQSENNNKKSKEKKNKVDFCSANVAVPPLPSFWSWPTRPCWLENQHLTAHSPSTLLAQCLTKPGKLGGDVAMLWRVTQAESLTFKILLLPKVLEVFWKGHSISFIEHMPGSCSNFFETKCILLIT